MSQVYGIPPYRPLIPKKILTATAINWVSVKDDLPKETKYYLVYCDSPNRGKQDGIDIAYYQHKAKNWKGMYNPSITHWSQLPKPPKEN